MKDRLTEGKRSVQLSFSTTQAVFHELRLWAEIAGWSVSKTVDFLVVEAIRSYDWKPASLRARGDTVRE